MMRHIYFACVVFISLFAVACGDLDQSVHDARYEREVVTDRTLLVYLAMNNSLSGYGQANIMDLLAGAEITSLHKEHGRVLVYQARQSRNPLLLEIKNYGGKGYIDTLKYYPAQNSVAPEVFRAVVDEIKRIAPARNYALVVGSHGSGWLPPSGVLQKAGASGVSEASGTSGTSGAFAPAEDLWVKQQQDELARVIMEENTGSIAMTLGQFAGAVHDGEFEYILLDICYGGGVEVVYELRNKAERIIASAAQIPGAGMPYDKIFGDLMAPQPQLENVCRKYYKHYNSMTDADKRTASIALYNCPEMDALAEAFKPIATNYRNQIASINTGALQRFDHYNPASMFDMEDFVHTLVPSSDPFLTAFDQALSRVVLYKVVTQKVMGNITVNTFCGISSYVPTDQMGPARNDYYYTNTAWGKKIYVD